MLTETEKQILGYMVDAGQLRGEERIAAGGSDVIAREKIAEFKTHQQQFLPMQIKALKEQKLNLVEDLEKQTALLTLLGE